MKKDISICSILLMAVSMAGAQTGLYTLASVPEALKAKAAVVTHLDDINYEIESLEKARYNVHRVFTVINEEGRDALVFQEYSTRYTTLGDVEIKVYDANGKQTERYRKKDLQTSGYGDGLIEDGFVTYYVIKPQSYPLTVEIKYEKKLNSTLSVPDFRFISPRESILSSSYTAKVPADMVLKYKAVNTNIQPTIAEEGKYKIYKWSVANLEPIEDEEGAVSQRSRYPYVAVVTEQFSHYGYRGNLSSWKNFGAWLAELYTGLDELPADRVQFFNEMVKNAPDQREKIRRIYSYLQENFRYVSIQLGIGGWRPFSASFTDQKKYGDCKGLSNYMKAALKAVGIRSHIAIINASFNEEPADPAFPANDFNHVILCVPGQSDSIWLECTSNTAEFAQLGNFTENRNALLITESGGALVPTPRSRAINNVFTSHTTISLQSDLSGNTKTQIQAQGEFREIMNEILKEKRDEQKKDIVYYLGFKQPDDFRFDKVEKAVQLEMVFSKIPEFNSGSKLFINPRLNKIWASRLPKSENRKLDYYFRFPFEKKDTTVFKLPPGFKPEVLAKEKQISCDYAVYNCKSWHAEQENAVYIVTSLVLNQYKIPAAGYASVKKFFDDVLQEDAQKWVVKAGEAEKKAF